MRPQFGSRWAAAIAEADETYIGKMGTRGRNRRVPPASKGCYSIFKRVMKGMRQHCKHLHRYLTKFDFLAIATVLSVASMTSLAQIAC